MSLNTKNSDENMFKFKNKNIDINIPEKNLNNNNKSKIDKLSSLSLSNNNRLAQDINNMMSNLSVELVSFIIEECGYKTSSKEFKKELINVIMKFKNSKLIKI